MSDEDNKLTRPLRVEEREEAVSALAASFDDDPLFRWMLPQPEVRSAWLSWFHRLSVESALASGSCWTLTDGASRGAITVVPPGGTGPTVGAYLRALSRPPKFFPTVRLTVTGLRIEARIEAVHPRDPMVYVHVLGVHPDHKGKGLGAALLGEALRLGEKLGVPVYLETANPVNLGFYARFGLKVQQELRVGGAPPLWTLKTEGVPTVSARALRR